MLSQSIIVISKKRRIKMLQCNMVTHWRFGCHKVASRWHIGHHDVTAERWVGTMDHSDVTPQQCDMSSHKGSLSLCVDIRRCGLGDWFSYVVVPSTVALGPFYKTSQRAHLPLSNPPTAHEYPVPEEGAVARHHNCCYLGFRHLSFQNSKQEFLLSPNYPVHGILF